MRFFLIRLPPARARFRAGRTVLASTAERALFLDALREHHNERNHGLAASDDTPLIVPWSVTHALE
jgi:hypothetical protein